jgi:hypothetical protein
MVHEILNNNLFDYFDQDRIAAINMGIKSDYLPPPSKKICLYVIFLVLFHAFIHFIIAKLLFKNINKKEEESSPKPLKRIRRVSDEDPEWLASMVYKKTCFEKTMLLPASPPDSD